MKNSPALLVAKLLRSLDDPDSVVRNELVAEVFAGRGAGTIFQGLRQAVLDAIEMLQPRGRMDTQDALHRRRQYEIIVRYELGGMSMHDVLATLCIEKSQFYRERSAALSYLARAVRRWVKAFNSPQAGGLITDEQYLIASVLQRTGNVALAERILQELLRTQSDPAGKLISLIRLAELNADIGDAAQAEMYLIAAGQLSHQVSPEYSDVMACEREIVCAQLAWSCGRTDEAQATLAHALPATKALLGGSLGRAKLVFAKALAAAANIEYHVGTLQRCESLVSMGRELLGVADAQTADVLAELLTVQTSIHTARGAAFEDAMNADQTLLELARTHGLVRKIAVGIKDLAVINRYQGNAPVALLYGDEAVALATAVCGSKERAVATFQWVHMRVEHSNALHLRGVQDVVAAMREKLPPRGYWWAYSFAMESYVCLAELRIPEALEAANEALSTFTAVKSHRGMGIAKSLHAEALHMLGDRTQARAYAKDAVRLLETAPQSHWLSHARGQLAIA